MQILVIAFSADNFPEICSSSSYRYRESTPLQMEISLTNVIISYKRATPTWFIEPPLEKG